MASAPIWKQNTIVFHSHGHIVWPDGSISTAEEYIVSYLEPIEPTLEEFLRFNTISAQEFIGKLLEKRIITMEMLVEIEQEEWKKFFQQNLTQA